MALAAAASGCGGSAGIPLAVGAGPHGPAAGPLRAPRDGSPFFLADSAGRRAIFLTGSHTWTSFQDWGLSDPPPAFDYPAYLDFLATHGHDFIRLYVWEQAAWFPGTGAKVVFSPLPYLRTGPGTALDGGPRFDLTRFDPEYFQRLRERVRAADERGLYVSVMLFDGWSIELKGQATGNPWRGHPFNRDNNVNGIDGDPDHDGQGKEVHTLRDPAITALQKAYLRKVVDTVGDLDNVLWEISNESAPGSMEWEYEMVRTLHALEATRPKQHPVGMTSPWPHDPRGNAPLFDGPADWVAPCDTLGDTYRRNPPPSTRAGKVVLTDTDHLWGIGGSRAWVWKSFLRGLNPIFMDPYTTTIRHNLPAWPSAAADRAAAASRPAPEWEDVRRAMGYARAMADRTDLAALRPMGALASSGYCLAEPGVEYLVYVPDPHRRPYRLAARLLGRLAAQRVELDASSARGALDVEWLDARRGLLFSAPSVTGGRRLELRPPFPGDAVLHVRRRANE